MIAASLLTLKCWKSCESQKTMDVVEFQCINHTFSTLGVDDYWNDNNFGQKCQCVMLRLACSCGTHSRSRLSLAAKYVSKPLELKVLSGIDSNSKGNICGACGYSLFFQFAHWLACWLVSSTTKLSSLLFVRYQTMDCKKFWGNCLSRQKV